MERIGKLWISGKSMSEISRVEKKAWQTVHKVIRILFGEIAGKQALKKELIDFLPDCVQRAKREVLIVPNGS